MSGARTTSEIVSDINSGTATHFVTASELASETILKSYDNGLNPANGDIVMVTSTDSGGTVQNLEITISDGNNSANVVFLSDDGTFPAAASYLTVSATSMANEINTVCQANNIDITASTEANTNGNYNAQYPKLVLTLGNGIGGTATGSTITDVATDAAGQSFQDATAMPLTAAATSDTTLVLTRADGGDILLTSTGTGTFVNSNGMVSSSAGTPALIVMIEDEEGSGGVAETGVQTRADYNKAPSATSSDEDSTGATITYTPFGDGAVIIKVNGLQINLADGAKDEACYFSADGGTTAKASADIAAGDTLYWMGSIAGYELEADDELDFVYDASSNDV